MRPRETAHANPPNPAQPQPPATLIARTPRRSAPARESQPTGTTPEMASLRAKNVTRSRQPIRATHSANDSAGQLLSTRKLATAHFIAHAVARRDNGAGPATVLNDLVWFGQVLRSVRPSLGVHVDLTAIEDARQELANRRLVAKSQGRTRRVTPAEEKKLLQHFASRDMRAVIPMQDIVKFALITCRRQEEICRLKWCDLDREKGIGWLDDVKHPRHTVGNRQAFRMLESAWEIIDRQPVDGDMVFPSIRGLSAQRLRVQNASSASRICTFMTCATRLLADCSSMVT